MKNRAFILMMALILVLGLLTGCGQKAAEEVPAEAPAENAEEIQEEAAELSLQGHSLMIYCGAGMANPFGEIAELFKTETGCEMNVSYANAGQIQSQINTSQEGDMFIAGSEVELKPVKDFVSASKPLVKHIPVLAVQAGNPKEINTLKDLTKEGVSFMMGDVDSTPIGKIAKKALGDAEIFNKVNIVATTTTAPQMATAIAAGEADAAIIWKENCKADGVQITGEEDMAPYIKNIPAASLSCSADAEALAAFEEFLDTQAVKDIWLKYGYEIAE